MVALPDPPDVAGAAGSVPGVESFRVAAGSVWAVEDNLSPATMDWEEFADVAGDGVFVDPGPA